MARDGSARRRRPVGLSPSPTGRRHPAGPWPNRPGDARSTPSLPPRAGEVAGGRPGAGGTARGGRFGASAGRSARKLAGRGVNAVLDPETQKPTPCDAAGRLEVSESPPGRYVLRLSKGNEGVRSG